MGTLSHRKLVILTFSAIAFYCALQHASAVVAWLAWLFSLVFPLVLGGAIAFILNVPMRCIEGNLFKKPSKLARPVSLVLTLVALLGVGTIASVVIVPNLREAFSTLPQQISDAASKLSVYLGQLSVSMPELETILVQLNLDWAAISKQALTFAQQIGNSALSSGGSILGGVVNGVSNFVLGLIFSFYILAQKERLARQGTLVLYALLPKKIAQKTVEVLRLSQRIFSSFLSGQCLEAIILGAMFVVAMTLLSMPYALLVGVLVSITALIPLVGAFIGCFVGAFLIALTNPMQAVVFLVMFLIIQQIEGNLIYPYVVGSSVGLPSIWVMVAVLLGGSLMGVVGMLVFIPLFSVGYTLFREFVYERLTTRGITL